MSASLDIVVPVYNEGASFLRTLETIERDVLQPHRVLVVYDLDDDTTLPPVHRFLETHPEAAVRLVKNRRGRGALNAIRSGFDESDAELCLVCMGDLSDDLAAVGPMLAKMDEGHDLVCGSRYMKGGRQVGGPLLKRTLSRAAGVSLCWFAGIPTHDATNSFKMYRRALLERIPVESRGGFEIGLELVVKAHALGYKVSEVPSTWRDRSEGKSNFKLAKWLPHYLRWYFYALRARLRGSRSYRAGAMS